MEYRERERMQQLRNQGKINLFEAYELEDLYKKDQEEKKEAELEKLRLAVQRIGQKMFTLTYKYGSFYSEPKDWHNIKVEIWAKDATEAAEIACKRMIDEESGWYSTGSMITDATTCRLDVFEGDQSEKHKAILVNPYGIAPSQQADGGPLGWAETVFKALTGKELEINTEYQIDIQDQS